VEREKMESENTRINVSLGYTLNLGNFQSLRIDVGVTDSRRENENIDQAFERVYGFVEEKLVSKVNEAKEEVQE
jgi:methyl coenzyme M reductase subunit D